MHILSLALSFVLIANNSLLLFGENSPHNIIHLTPPSVSSEHIQERITCIRPKHAEGFQVYGEIKNNKLIVHNYGHSGGGWTLLFGSVQKTIDEFESKLAQNVSFKDQPICVVGAGCIGLYSAIRLTQKGYRVNIVAENFSNLTSHKAAGIFFPSSLYAPSVQDEQSKKVNTDCLQEYCAIINGSHSFITSCAAQFVPIYVDLETDYSGLGFWQDPKFVTVDFGNGKQYAMKEYITIFIDVLEMMAQLNAQIQALGIALEQKHVASFDDIREPIIFNCTGLGAQQLAHDAHLSPLQGHLMRLTNQPEKQKLNYIIHTKVMQRGKEAWVYFVPKWEGLLGVTFIEGEGRLDANCHEFDLMLERAQDYFGCAQS